VKRDTSKDPIYYHIILESKELYENIGEDFFEGSPIQPIFELAKKYCLRYKSAPKKDDIFALIDRLDIDEDDKAIKYDKARVQVIYSRKDEVNYYGTDALIDEVKTIYRWVTLQKSLENGITEFKLMDDQITPETVDKAISDVFCAISEKNVVNFEEENAAIIDFWDPASHKAENLIHWPTGFKFFDLCLDGGYWPGSLHLMLGSPKVGKSMWLCNMAARSVMSGNDTMYITLEMENSMVSQRIASCMLNITQLDYKNTRDNEVELGKVMAKVKKNATGPVGALCILRYPTDTLTAVKMAELIRKEEEKRSSPGLPFKFKTIFIDYISIMRSSMKDRSNMYLDGKRKAEEVRAQSQINNWAIISAIQTNKDQYGASDINETQVSESSGYNATVDTMFGIIHDESLAAQGKYRIKNIYDRVADYQNKSTQFLFSTDFLRMEEYGDVIESSDAIALKFAKEKESSVRATNFARQGIAAASMKGGKPVPVLDRNAKPLMQAPKSEEAEEQTTYVVGGGLFAPPEEIDVNLSAPAIEEYVSNKPKEYVPTVNDDTDTTASGDVYKYANKERSRTLNKYDPSIMPSTRYNRNIQKFLDEDGN